jgi:hypothetical protein
MRRLITLISVGWLPLYLHPSGACLNLGTSTPGGLVTPSRVTPHRGCISSNELWPFTLQLFGTLDAGTI